MRTSPPLRALLLATTLLSAVPATATPKPKPAASKEAAREAALLATRAKTAFKEGQFDDAARLFMKAYAVSGEAALVYNAARAYEEGGKVGDAVGLFRLYTTIADDPDGIADARERIRKLEAGRLGAGAPAPAAADPAASPPATAPESAGAKPSAALPTVLRAAPPDRTWLWVAAGTAGLAAAGGATLLALGASASRDANAIAIRSPGDIDRYNTAYDDADRLRNFGWAGMGVAAVAGGAAAWLWLRQPVAVAFDPRGGFTVAGRF